MPDLTKERIEELRALFDTRISRCFYATALTPAHSPCPRKPICKACELRYDLYALADIASASLAPLRKNKMKKIRPSRFAAGLLPSGSSLRFACLDLLRKLTIPLGS